MMKRYSIFMVVATLLLTFAACDKNNMPGFGFTTDSILTLTFEKELDAAAIGVGTQNCNPVGMRRSGDTLYSQPCRRIGWCPDCSCLHRRVALLVDRLDV